MKRIIVIIMLACTALITTQCKKADVKPIPTPGELSGEMIDVTLRVDNGNSKTDITAGGVISWNEGDIIYVVGATNGLLGHITAQNSGASAYFTGSINKGTVSQIFHYYYVGNNTFTNANYTYDISTQDGNINNIETNKHLMHGDSGDAIAVGTTNLGTINMVSMMSLARINFKANDIAASGNITCKGTYSSAIVDITTGQFTTRTSGDITLNSVNSDYYMVLIPNADNSDQTLEFRDNNYNLVEITKPIVVNKIYSASDGTPFVVNLEALYVDIAPGTGLFEVSNDNGTNKKNVKFAKGNLVYYGPNYDATNLNESVWKMHSKQWAYVWGIANGYSSTEGTFVPATDKVFDLFGWGTGRLDGSLGGHPWTNVYTNGSYGGQDRTLNSGDASSSTIYDWGKIISGGGVWYSLTSNQWEWIINSRQTGITMGSTENCRYAEVKVKGVPGLLIFPTDFSWTSAMGPQPTTINAFSSNWNGMDYNTSQFAWIEAAGAVFLPASGARITKVASNPINTVVVNGGGTYWSSFGSTANTNQARYLQFNDSKVETNLQERCNGRAVRLVMDVND